MLNLGTLTGYLELDDTEFDGALARAADHLKGFATKGAAIAGAAGLAIAGAIGTSIVAGMNLEAGRDKLAAELGLSEPDSARIGKIAGKVFAQNYGDSMGEVNDAVAAVLTSIDGMAHASSKELQATTIDALNFAKVFEVDIARAAQVAGEVIKYGLAKDSSEAFDLLVASSQRVPKALREDLLDAIDEYGPNFKQLGLSGKEAFALLVDGSKQGMYGIDKTGDALKEFTIRATDMSASSKTAYNTLGLSAKEMADDILAGGDRASDATQRIVDGLLGIKDPAKQANTAIALFGTPLEDLGTKNIPAFLKALDGGSKSMDGFGGAAKRMDTTLNANAISSLGALKRQAQVAFFTLGNWALPKVNQLSAALSASFGPALAMVVAVLGDLWSAAAAAFGFIASHDTTFKVIAGIILTLLIPAIISMGVQATISAAKMVAGWVASAAGAAATAALSVASHTLIASGWLRTGVQATISAAQMAAAWFIALGPIGWAIAAIALVVAVVIRYWDQISAFTKAAWDKVSGAVMGAVNWVIDFVKSHWPLILAIITGPIGLAVLFIVRNMDKIRAVMSAAWSAVRSAASSTWSAITGVISSGAARIVSLITGIPGRLRALASTFKSAGVSLIRSFVNGLSNAGDFVSNIAGNVTSAVKGAINAGIDKINSHLKIHIDWPGPGAFNWQASIPHLADGGIVTEPTLILAGEAGPELIQPLSGPKAKEAQRNVFGGSEMGPAELQPQVTQNIYPQPGQSEESIADAAFNRLMFAMT